MKEQSDEELVEKSGFLPLFKLQAGMGLASLRMLKGLSQSLKIPMDQITREHILQECARDNADSLRFKKYITACAGKSLPPK